MIYHLFWCEENLSQFFSNRAKFFDWNQIYIAPTKSAWTFVTTDTYTFQRYTVGSVSFHFLFRWMQPWKCRRKFDGFWNLKYQVRSRTPSQLWRYNTNYFQATYALSNVYLALGNHTRTIELFLFRKSMTLL